MNVTNERLEEIKSNPQRARAGGYSKVMLERLELAEKLLGELTEKP